MVDHPDQPPEGYFLMVHHSRRPLWGYLRMVHHPDRPLDGRRAAVKSGAVPGGEEIDEVTRNRGEVGSNRGPAAGHRLALLTKGTCHVDERRAG